VDETHSWPISTPDFPPYAFVPGGPFPHPIGSPAGHMAGAHHQRPAAIVDGEWNRSADYLRGISLFNAGYYWEAHEAWEGLWHAHGRKGPVADLLKGLIKLAAAGVKVRQGQRHGVVTHAARAAQAFASAKAGGRESLGGFNLDSLIGTSEAIAESPVTTEVLLSERVAKVFEFELRPE